MSKSEDGSNQEAFNRTYPKLSYEQALFLASIPGEFCSLSDAISVSSSVNRTAPIEVGAAKEAIEIAAAMKLVEKDSWQRVRLGGALRKERERLTEEEGYFECAVATLSNLILELATR